MAELAEAKLQHAPSTVHSTAWYQEIHSLAGQCHKEPPKLKLPKISLWSHVYRSLFHWQIDKIVSVGLTAVSAGYLFLGVAHSVGMFPESHLAYTKAEISNEMAYATVGLAWPMLMVLSAKFCLSRCTAFVKYQLDNIAKKELASGQEDVDAVSAELDEKAKNAK